MATRSDDTALAGFAALDALIRAAVERSAQSDVNPSDPLRGLYISDERAQVLAGEEGSAPGEIDDRLRAVALTLGLTPLDTIALALCAAPELDTTYGSLYGYLNDDVTRRLASPRLVARLLASVVPTEEVLGRLGAAAPLRRLGVLRPAPSDDGSRPIADRLLKVADVVSSRLLGSDLHSHREAGLWRIPAPAIDVGRAGAVERIRALAGGSGRLTVAAVGTDALAVVAAARAAPLWVIDAVHLDADLLVEGRLRAALDRTWLAVVGLDEVAPDARARVAAALREPMPELIVVARRREALTRLADGTTLVVEVPGASAAERRAVWSELVPGDGVQEVASKFRLDPERIAQAVEVATVTARAEGREAPGPSDLDAGARSASSGSIGDLASRLPHGPGWDRLVLPERPLRLLRSITANLRHRDTVLADWDFASTVGALPGVKVLFAGESGTGKTMSAQILARDLGLDLFRIDLATVVSKYIGETEKNLDRVFDAAEGSNAILFFDEADALFGKRSEVGDAHDRYANIEVSYLLQRMETYQGMVVLATNLRQNIDEAFLRRLDVVVDFPFPEADERERIWQLLLPAGAPREADVDLAFLAARFRLSGGGIRNAALAGAFAAADEGRPIGMRHLVGGVAREFTKQGRLTLESDFGEFHSEIRSADGG